MTMQDIAVAMRRAATALQRRPALGLHDDAAATARWGGGARVVASHANGTRVATDMPRELGGTGDQVTPGWLFRAGLASCAATRIAMAAAAAGIELEVLEVTASSRSDTRGMLGMVDGEATPVCVGPQDVQMQVRISAPAAPPRRLRALVEEGCRCAPVVCAVENAVPVAVHIVVEGE